MKTKKTFSQRFETWWRIVDRPAFPEHQRWVDAAVRRLAKKAYNLGRKHERESRKLTDEQG